MYLKMIVYHGKSSLKLVVVLVSIDIKNKKYHNIAFQSNKNFSPSKRISVFELKYQLLVN